MLQAFRIEHQETGLGPFQTPGELTQRLAKRASENPALPAPFEDGLGLADIPWTFVFGCPSLDTMRQWVLHGNPHEDGPLLKQLENQGFVLREFLVESGDCRLGKSGKQLAFDAQEAQQVCQHSLHTLLS